MASLGRKKPVWPGTAASGSELAIRRQRGNFEGTLGRMADYDLPKRGFADSSSKTRARRKKGLPFWENIVDCPPAYEWGECQGTDSTAVIYRGGRKAAGNENIGQETCSGDKNSLDKASKRYKLKVFTLGDCAYFFVAERKKNAPR